MEKYVLSEDYFFATNFTQKLAQILLGIPMDPILNFQEKANRELPENIYFYRLLVYSFELWLFVLRRVAC